MSENGDCNGASGEKRKAEENGDEGAKKCKINVEAGILLFSGATDWKEVGRKAGDIVKSKNTQWSPVRLDALKDIKVRAVNKGSISPFCFAITEDGEVYAWGRNEKGQLGLGDTVDRKVPTLIEELTGYDITEIATGKNHTLFLTSEGKVLVSGDNSSGQCGVGKGSKELTKPKLMSHSGPDVVHVACGGEFSAIVDEEGNIYTCGLPEYGQLGHNDDGKFMQKANKIEFRNEYVPKQVLIFVEKDTKNKEVIPLPAPKITKISCGLNHTVAIDDKFKAYSWGFGGYGRLGHAETADEMVPRLISALSGPRRGIADVVCGQQFNVAVAEIPGLVHMWGAYTAGKEANMYPKQIYDLSGWNIRGVACNTKGWLVMADENIIAAMPSPCHGELAMGTIKKSSAKPTIVDTLEDLHVIQLGAGPAHSLFICRDDDAKDHEALEQFPVLDQSDD